MMCSLPLVGRAREGVLPVWSPLPLTPPTRGGEKKIWGRETRMKSFSGKVAAVTGAASGMGRELAVELARRHCDVAISDVDMNGLEQTAALARELGAKVTTTKLDVAQRDAVYAWADQVA